MNKRPFILDACTLINIFRIDEDEILYSHLQSYNIKIAEIVLDEVKKNIFKKIGADFKSKFSREMGCSLAE